VSILIRILSTSPLLALALLASAAPTQALERQSVDSTVVAPGGLARSAPFALSWSSPDNNRFWARAEGPPRRLDDQVLRGAVSMGQHIPVLDCGAQAIGWCDGLRLNMTPVMRAIPDAPQRNGGTAPAAGFALAQSLDYKASPAISIRAGLDIGDRLGVGAPLVAGGSGLVAKARIGFGADLGRMGLGVPLRVDASVIRVADLDGAPIERSANDCQGILDFRLASYAPLRVTLPCNTSGAPRFGFGIRGEF
jgi:hypothetical protein